MKRFAPYLYFRRTRTLSDKLMASQNLGGNRDVNYFQLHGTWSGRSGNKGTCCSCAAPSPRLRRRIRDSDLGFDAAHQSNPGDRPDQLSSPRVRWSPPQISPPRSVCLARFVLCLASIWWVAFSARAWADLRRFGGKFSVYGLRASFASISFVGCAAFQLDTWFVMQDLIFFKK